MYISNALKQCWQSGSRVDHTLLQARSECIIVEALADREFSLAKQKRRTINPSAAHDFADKQDMVAKFMRRSRFALEPGQRTVDQRNVVNAFMHTDIGETIRMTLRKLSGQTELMGLKNVDREEFCRLEYRQTARAQAQTPKHQRWAQRQRIKAAGRQANLLAGIVDRGHYGDTRSEHSEAVANVPLVGHRSSVIERVS